MKYLARITPFLAFCLIAPSLALTQDKGSKREGDSAGQTESSISINKVPSKLSLTFGLAEDTPVKLKLTRTMSSKDAKADEKVDFEVLEDVKVGETIVIQHGGMAIGTVTEAHPKRRMGRAGKLNINI